IYDNETSPNQIDGEEVRCIRTTNGRKFHFDSSVVGGDAVANLRFGPVTPDAASVDFVHLVSNQSQQGNSVYKNIKHNPGWNSKSTSRQMQRGNAVVSAKMPTPGTFFGLHQLGNGNASYTSLAWSFHRSENGEWYIFENGSAVGFLATSFNGVTFGNETEFRIEYDGVRVRYWADGVLMREVTSGVSMNVSYQAGVSIDGNSRRVSNIHFGAFTDNAWLSVGGSGRPEDNATVGATAGTNLRRSNNAVVGDAEVLNEAQQWSQVQSKDVWLTDGRIPTGIDAAGRSQGGIVGGSGAVVPNIDLMGTPNGLNLAINPEFMDGAVTDWVVYNNAGGSKVTRTIIADATAPNASGYILRVAYDGTGTEGIDPTPEFGGVYQYLDDALNMTGNARARPGRYARGSTIIYSIIARIPVGRTLGFHTNSFGAEGSFEWLTPVAGTGNWQRYVGRQKIGVTGTFQSTSYFAIGGGPNSAFTWDIAKCDQIDITSSPRLFLGRNGLSREDGLPLFDADVRNQLQQWTDIQGSLKPENNADVTSYITGSAKIVIECDANGTPLSGQLTKTTVYKLLKNGIDETVNATWSSIILSGTLTQSTANTGVNSISAISTATAKIRISATLGSAVRSFDVDVEKRLAAPETGGSGSGGTAATVPVNLSSNSTTMVTASNELIFNTGSAGSATMTGIVYFTTDGGPPHGSWSAYWIWQRWNGSTWVDVDSEVAAVQSAVVSREWDGTDWFYYDSQNGELHVGKVITGLSANSQVKFRLRVRSAGGLRTLYYNTFGVNIGGQGS
ncbi:hypothetical protein K4H03_20560, partial [Mycobacterium tuberculosis]|nr:hypothetical protein [Mycobacterium tuberculosis]